MGPVLDRDDHGSEDYGVVIAVDVVTIKEKEYLVAFNTEHSQKTDADDYLALDPQTLEVSSVLPAADRYDSALGSWLQALGDSLANSAMMAFCLR